MSTYTATIRWSSGEGFIDEVIMPHSTRRPGGDWATQAQEQAAREPVEEA